MTPESVTRFGSLALLMCSCLILLPGCSPGGGDCTTTEADALVNIDEDSSTDLLVAAVTSSCDEVAVYEQNGKVSQAAFKDFESGDETVVEYDEEGRVQALRDDDGNTTVFSYNDDQDYVRTTTTDPSGSESSSVFAIPRQNEAARAIAQSDSRLAAFCNELLFYDDLLVEACRTEPQPTFCLASIEEATEIAKQLCTATNIEEPDSLEGGFGNERQDFDCFVDGFATVRDAARGVTVILSAESGPFGMSGGWTLVEAPNEAVLDNLGGLAAVVDIPEPFGTYVFEATAEDDSGCTASDTV